jgi:hypothetical protein
MPNAFLNTMKSFDNYKYTENGAVSYKSTLNGVMDMFALGGAYRKRDESDVWVLFRKAWKENRDLAMKCLFYLRDCRGGQGERRFFRVIMNRMMNGGDEYRQAVSAVIGFIPEFGRWDDLIYSAFDTPYWGAAMEIVKNQLGKDLKGLTRENEGISLLGKWLPSENASSHTTTKMGSAVRQYLGISHKQYRKVLSNLRARINVLERLMSAQKWDEIHFDAIPSKAGLKYRNAFAHNEFLAARYEAFMKSKETKVNAGVLNPVDIAHQIFNASWHGVDQTARNAWQKYWDNLPDYYNGRQENGICVVDVSGSMSGTPMEAAVSLGAYIADKAEGPFKNHFITFSSNPSLVEFEGVDIYDKFQRARRADWGGSTNIEGTMDLILNTCIKGHCKMPDRLYIFTDMEFNAAVGGWSRSRRTYEPETLFEGIERKFNAHGYKMPQVVFWNLDARQDTIPAIGGRYSYVSGFNPNMIECILSGKTGWDLCLEKLLSERYQAIHA